MEEKLTIKQLFAILAAGLFSFCGVLIENGYYDSYFILFKKKISDKKIIFDSRVLIFNRIDC